MTTLSAIQVLEQQEQLLVFDGFNEVTAYQLGQALHDAATLRNAPVVIDIRSTARRYFFAALPGAHPDNEDWARRKGNVVLRCHASSYLVRLRLEAEGRLPWPDAALPNSDYATHGGGFPVSVRGTGVVASIAVSGLPSHEDHDLIVSAVARHIDMHDVPATPVPKA